MLSENAYSRPVTLKNVLRFAVPTIVMTVFMSFYTMVDGLFVSNLIGTDALSAVNLTAPIISLVTAISTMLATGGSAVIMRKVGEQKATEANEDFTFSNCCECDCRACHVRFRLSCHGRHLWKHEPFAGCI